MGVSDHREKRALYRTMDKELEEWIWESVIIGRREHNTGQQKMS